MNSETSPSQPKGVIIYTSQVQAIDKVLDKAYETCPAQFILLTDVSGQLISLLGKREKLDPVALSSLIAGDMAASQEVAKIIGQYQHCQLIVREGLGSNIFVAEAGESLILFVLVEKDVPLGWVRLIINETSNKLAEIMTTHDQEEEEVQTIKKQENEPEDLTNWLDNALNSLWTEE